MNSRSVRISAENLKYILIALVCGVVFLPFLWIVVSSLKDITEIFEPSHILPHNPTLENFEMLFRVTALDKNFLNSIIVATVATTVTVALGSLAAYGFSRFKFIGNRILLLFVLISRLIPPVTILIPLYVLVRILNLIDTKLCLILLYTTFNLPTVIWISKIFFDQLPRDLFDAAKIDGCTNLKTLLFIVVPLSTPCLAVSSVLAFVSCWNEFLLANTFATTDMSKTITVGLLPFINPTQNVGYALSWGHSSAGVLIALGPIIVLAAFFQKYLVSGLLAGSMKG